MIVKKTCINKLTALTITLNRYNHASPRDHQTVIRYGSRPVIVDYAVP